MGAQQSRSGIKKFNPVAREVIITECQEQNRCLQFACMVDGLTVMDNSSQLLTKTTFNMLMYEEGVQQIATAELKYKRAPARLSSPLRNNKHYIQELNPRAVVLKTPPKSYEDVQQYIFKPTGTPEFEEPQRPTAVFAALPDSNKIDSQNNQLSNREKLMLKEKTVVFPSSNTKDIASYRTQQQSRDEEYLYQSVNDTHQHQNPTITQQFATKPQEIKIKINLQEQLQLRDSQKELQKEYSKDANKDLSTTNVTNQRDNSRNENSPRQARTRNVELQTNNSYQKKLRDASVQTITDENFTDLDVSARSKSPLDNSQNNSITKNFLNFQPIDNSLFQPNTQNWQDQSSLDQKIFDMPLKQQYTPLFEEQEQQSIQSVHNTTDSHHESSFQSDVNKSKQMESMKDKVNRIYNLKNKIIAPPQNTSYSSQFQQKKQQSQAKPKTKNLKNLQEERNSRQKNANLELTLLSNKIQKIARSLSQEEEERLLNQVKSGVRNLTHAIQSNISPSAKKPINDYIDRQSINVDMLQSYKLSNRPTLDANF